MLENKYDDEVFFAKYCQFPRSVEGLKAAGEWHQLRRMLPGFAGKRVLDIGCGMGWHCRYAAEQGAAQVVGTDISAKMLAEARQRNSAPNIVYRQLAMEELDYPADSFDIVLSSLAFHYTPDFAAVCQRIASCLASGGELVFSVEHPIFTAEGREEWVCDETGKPLYWPVDHYFTEGRRETTFLGEQVVKYHRTLTTYLNTLLEEGFRIKAVCEPQPAPELLDEVEGMREELRRPMMLLVAAQKMR